MASRDELIADALAQLTASPGRFGAAFEDASRQTFGLGGGVGGLGRIGGRLAPAARRLAQRLPQTARGRTALGAGTAATTSSGIGVGADLRRARNATSADEALMRRLQPSGRGDSVGNSPVGLGGDARGGAPPALGGPPGQDELDEIMAMLSGGGGTDLGALGGSFDAEINALRQGGARMAGLTNQLIGNIQGSAGAAQGQIGGFFDYAQGQAEAGRPVIADSFQGAQDATGAAFDTLAGSLAGMPQQFADSARAAGGQAAGSTVADRVAAAAAPFAAAGESDRAAVSANLTQHSTAGQDYLTQLASAAPSEAAMAQSAVAGRANQAVTSAQMALAQQQAQIEARAASLEGAKQRALLDATADTAGDVFEREMQAIGLFNARLDLEDRLNPQEQGLSLQDQSRALDIERKQRELDPLRAFEQELAGTSPGTQRLGQEARDLWLGGERGTTEILGALEGVGDFPTREEPRGLSRLLPWVPDTQTVGGGTAQTLEELVQAILNGEEGSLHAPDADTEALRRALLALDG